MDISLGTESLYSTNLKTATDKVKAESLQEKLKAKAASDEEIMEACKSFEAYMLEQVFKEMEKSIPNNGDKNPYIEQFGSKLYEEYAKQATENEGVGIAKMLYEAMKRSM